MRLGNSNTSNVLRLVVYKVAPFVALIVALACLYPPVGESQQSLETGKVRLGREEAKRPGTDWETHKDNLELKQRAAEPGKKDDHLKMETHKDQDTTQVLIARDYKEEHQTEVRKTTHKAIEVIESTLRAEMSEFDDWQKTLLVGPKRDYKIGEAIPSNVSRQVHY